MKVVLFDLGRTLEDGGVLLPGAVGTLKEERALEDADGRPVVMGLVSDFDMPVHPGDPAEVKALRQIYLGILETLGIRHFFEPAGEWVTLSTEVGEFKPHNRVFRTALDTTEPGLPFRNAIVATENRQHV